jgi:hypothetical protein
MLVDVGPVVAGAVVGARYDEYDRVTGGEVRSGAGATVPGSVVVGRAVAGVVLGRLTVVPLAVVGVTGAMVRTGAVTAVLELPAEAAAGVWWGPRATTAAIRIAVAAEPTATSSARTVERGTTSSLAGAEVEVGTWAQGGGLLGGAGGGTGMAISSPGKIRLGSAGKERWGRLTWTTCHQYRARMSSGGGCPHCEDRIASAIDHRLSPGCTVQRRGGGAGPRSGPLVAACGLLGEARWVAAGWGLVIVVGAAEVGVVDGADRGGAVPTGPGDAEEPNVPGGPR